MEDPPVNEFTQRCFDHGNKYEGIALRKYLEKAFKKEIEELPQQQTYYRQITNKSIALEDEHLRNFWVSTTPDYVLNEDVLIEIKCPYHRCVIRPEPIDFEKENTVKTVLKRQHYLQVQLQMFLTEAEECQLVYYYPFKQFEEQLVPFFVRREKTAINLILEACSQAYSEATGPDVLRRSRLFRGEKQYYETLIDFMINNSVS